jgi:hypothetical protein
MLQSFNNCPFSSACPLLSAPVALASSVGLRRLWEQCPLPLIKEQSRAVRFDLGRGTVACGIRPRQGLRGASTNKVPYGPEQGPDLVPNYKSKAQLIK